MVFGPRRVGRPGLLRGAARTAAVVGTATATRNAVNRRAQRKYAEQDAQEYYEQQQAYAPPPQQYAPPPAPAAPAEDETISKLKQLGELHNQGILSDEEFASAKAKLLG